jgi:hypothetical protein
MRVHSTTRYAAIAALVSALACAGNTARTDDAAEADQAAAARDTTTVQDTLGGQTENPPGYRGMERDTTQVPPGQPSDTFLQQQGQGTPQDTAGYGGVERVDTTGGAAPADTTGYGRDTTGAAGVGDTSGMTGLDTTGTAQPADTTGYNPSQESRDTTYR